ncbi:MAG TPA: glycosyltransferase, partial [Citricoccus sp.]
AAAEVASRYGRQDAVVATPGTDPAAPSPGALGRGVAAGLLWLGRLTQAKDPLTFLDALARVRDLEWTARLAGPDTVDPALTARVRDRVHRAGLGGRVCVPGPLAGPGLEQAWDGTDLLVHTSRAETYGMVVAEALARGIPALVAAGTGAQEALRAGAVFPPGDVETLAGTLRSWLTDGRLQERWRRDAAAGRAVQAGWDQTAAAVWGALTSGTARGPRPPGPGARPTPRARTRPGPAA